ncbi:DUF6531 domain-containing protein [Streptomyces tanashiensis]|uniref:DUF6531 domain-containing protein n=1 Tax=Streptomyces tanashiensis TaxID=67367 RepID=UPI003687CE43
MAVTVPDWADTLLDLVGVNWPNVDEDAYREMADALREFADDLADDGQLANNHMERLLSSGHGEAMDALNEHWTKVKGKHLKDMVSAARTIADALDMVAGAIEVMKGKALVELGVLAGQTGLAMALIPVTGGLSALLGAGAIAFTKKQLLKLITAAMEEAVAHVVSVMTEPVVAALENMAADLVVQVSMDALGVQNGVDLDRTKQAGKDGFDEGVQGAKEGLNLASAGGGGGGGGKGFHIEHDEHDQAGTRLNGVSAGIHGRTAGKLTKAKGHQGRNKGRDDIADALDPVIEKAMGALVKSAKTMGDHIGDTLPKAVKQISKDHKNNDDDTAARIARQRKGDHDNGSGGKPDTGNRKRDDLGTARTRPEPLRDAASDPRRNGIELRKKTCETDPVDVATGEMTLQQTDLSLPGSLPLVLGRTHLSDYRYGQWFGPSWASTLDERLELDPSGAGAVWAREDGSLLVYPHLPVPGGEPVLPLEGPRLALLHGGQEEDRTTYQVTDPHTGLTRCFTGSPYQPSIGYWLTAIRDRNDNCIAFSRRPDGSPTAVTHSGGYTVQVTTANARVHALALRTPAGPVTVMRFGHDEHGHLTEVFNDSDLSLRLSYDPDGRITSWTDRNDSSYRYVYDSAGRVVRTIGPDGCLSATFSYDTHPETGDRITRFTDSTGATKVYVLNDRLQVVSETDALGHTVRRTWDRYDRLLSVTGPLGHTTTYDWDEQGNRTRITWADGQTSTASYDERNLPTTVSAPGGVVRTLAYDDRGNRTAETDPTGATTLFTYDRAGRLTAVEDALGNVTHVQCDGAGLPVMVTDPLQGRSRYERDSFGRPVRITDTLGATTHLEWTVGGRPARRVEPDGTQQSWTYDGEGNCVAYTDAMGAISRFEYTHFDRLSARTGPDGLRYEFAYDTELRLTTVTDPRHLTWRYAYDSTGRLVSETDFDSRVLSYSYDAAGRLTERLNGAGQRVGFAYNELGQVTSKDASGSLTSYAYDASGRMARITSPESELSRTWDLSGRVLSETVNGRTTTFAYDAAGRRSGRTTPTGAHSGWTYDAAGRRSALRTGGRTITFERDTVGRELARHIGESVAVTQKFDVQGRVAVQVVNGRGRLAQHRTYAYREDGHLVAVDDRLSGSRRFDLDAGGKVTAVTAEGWSERYAYDETGGQTEASWPASHPGHEAVGRRTYSGTRLVEAGNVRYEHDAQGRVVLRQQKHLSRKPSTWRYGWDAEDRLVSVTTPDGDRWRYTYDPVGRRMSKQRIAADGASIVEQTDFSWDGSTLCEQTTRADFLPHPVTLTWDHDGLRPLAQTERILGRDTPQSEVDTRFFAIVTDLVGTPSELVDENGDIAWRTRSTLWGGTTWAVDSTAYTPLRFPGQYFDPESGLHHNFRRHYDPQTGRYLSPDPLGLAPAPNPSVYVHNPHTWSDHLGLAPECDDDTQSLWKAPQRGQGDAQERDGYLEENFPGGPDDPYMNGLVYFAKERELAEKYAPHYGEGIIEVRIPRADYDARYAQYERPYEGGPLTELEIPNTVVEELNKYPRFRHR